MSTLFPGTHETRQKIAGVDIFARAGGSGPPLLLIHGFPQTHAMWHKVAPELMQRFTCVMPDLRGYGDSSKPEDGEYSQAELRADQPVLEHQRRHKQAEHDVIEAAGVKQIRAELCLRNR